MIVYKGTKKGWYGNLRYCVGKTYILEKYQQNLIPTEFGFHKDIADVNYECRLDDPYTEVFEIEIPENAQIIQEVPCINIIVTNKFKVLRKLSNEDIEQLSNNRIKFDDQRRLNFVKHLDGTIEKYKYNEKGEMFYYKVENDREELYKYNNKGRLVTKFAKSERYWFVEKYNEHGNVIYERDSNGNRYKRIEKKLQNGLRLVRIEKIEINNDYINQPRLQIEKLLYSLDGTLLLRKINDDIIYKIRIE